MKPQDINDDHMYRPYVLRLGGKYAVVNSLPVA